MIRAESSNDFHAIRVVNCLAFGGEDEARLVDALRDGGHAKVSLFAEEDGQIVCHILFSELPILTNSVTVQAVSLVPLAVVPSHQRKGIGSALVEKGLRACQEPGQRIVVVLGHPKFYTRFGFSADLAKLLISPFSGPAFMALELVPGAVDGIEGEVQYPPPFGSF